MRIAVLASHRGSNLQAIIDACARHVLDAVVCVVISNNSGSGALTRARSAGIATAHISAATHADPKLRDAHLLSILRGHDASLVVTAGYMKRLGAQTLTYYQGRIVNTHPSLLPAYGGAGMYGMAVHEAVLAAQESVTGVTIHLVEGDYDTGQSVAQRTIPVLADDTPESLATRSLKHEHALLIDTLLAIESGTITLPPDPLPRE